MKPRSSLPTLTQWPRPLVPYKRIYGVTEPRTLKPLANDGKLSPHLPAGTLDGLSPEERTTRLWWRDRLPCHERVHLGPEEFDAWLDDLLATARARGR